MREIRNFVALLSLLLVVMGCGGSGTLTPSPFAGQWAGTWDQPTLDLDGTANLAIANDGSVAGTVRINQLAVTGTLGGRISNAGQVSGTVQYPGELPMGLSGTMTINQQGQLVGDLIQRIAGSDHAVSFNLTRQ